MDQGFPAPKFRDWDSKIAVRSGGRREHDFVRTATTRDPLKTHVVLCHSNIYGKILLHSCLLEDFLNVLGQDISIFCLYS